MSDALKDLIAAVEAGLPSPTNWRNFRAVPPADADNSGPLLAHRAYHGSLDAAKSLHEALLPGVRYLIGADDSGFPDEFGAVLFSDPKQHALSISPARAWMLAILRAYEATHDR